jgi:ribosomal protein L7/L12
MEYFGMVLLVLFATLVVLLVGAAVRTVVSEIRSRVATISRIEAKLDVLLKEAHIDFDPYPNVQPGIIDALQKGQKIEAIKMYRQSTPGVGLKQAKEFIEAVQRRAGV